MAAVDNPDAETDIIEPMKAIVATAAGGCMASASQGGAETCSTFMLKRSGRVLVGHNLDEYIDVPGLVLANKRGVPKVSASWQWLTAEPGAAAATEPRLRWTSMYGSLVYTTRGRECIDGGLNEAGLYVGEMTLMGTEYPEVPGKPRMYQVLWMQWLLDICETVSDVVARLGDVQIDGTCQWHFFVADEGGDCAIIEFLRGEPHVYRGADLPIPLLCNAPYESELEALRRYQEPGGDAPVEADRAKDPRFVWGAEMLAERDAPGEDWLGRAWDILVRIRGESNRWGIIYDLGAMRMYFLTNEAPRPRFVDFSSFDFASKGPPLALDINEDVAGDVAGRFSPLTTALNRWYAAELWRNVDGGPEFNTLIKPRAVERSARFIEELEALE